MSDDCYTVPSNLKRARRRFPWLSLWQLSLGKLLILANTFLMRAFRVVFAVTRE